MPKRCWTLIPLIAVALLAGRVSASHAQTIGTAGTQAVDPADTRLVLTPTARTLPRGNVSLTLLGMLPLVQVGITDRVSIGGGAWGWSFDEGRPIVFLLPKVQVYRGERTLASVGAIHFIGPDQSSIGMAFGVVTRGNDRTAWTGGAGVLYARSSANGGAAPAAIVGVDHRLAARHKLVADAYVFDTGAIANVAWRYTRVHFAADVGLMIVGVDDGFAVPMAVLAWRFGSAP
jgi:hypothetical protein